MQDPTTHGAPASVGRGLRHLNNTISSSISRALAKDPTADLGPLLDHVARKYPLDKMKLTEREPRQEKKKGPSTRILLFHG